MFQLVTFCILTANFSGLMCQDVFVTHMVPNYFCIDSNSIMSSVFIASFNNLLMILESIYRFNKFNSFSHLYRAVSWYARVDIFNSLIRYLSPTD